MRDTAFVDGCALERFVETFWGYGRFDAPLWFVGMEEACGRHDFPLRFSAWRRRGERTIDDAAEYHREINAGSLFSQGAPLQKTWDKLIRCQLAAFGKPAGKETARRFQVEKLGRVTPSTDPTCLIELMPLPSPSQKDWWISEYTDLEYLQSRKLYMREILPRRIEALNGLIAQYTPKAVVFYGMGYRRSLEKITGALKKSERMSRLFEAKGDQTRFFLTAHPTFHGMSNDHFIELGDRLRDSLK
ncbi:hypothetical protein [Citreimonas salinaria]|uniref:Uracil DNA glycosylase superfamily protein n=1 Tax=Citreimonas salinaria TaxID=321339 RepID=A0A1H3NJK8_9RHOB|nr:hypothetical protein [Citreimonas salinaria]SDY88399.1 hypothetical protein SAMN05444340_12431 [Citreimonas salinaria]